MSNGALIDFLEKWNIVSTGVTCRRVYLIPVGPKAGVYRRKKSGGLGNIIEDWSAPVQQGEDIRVVTDALMKFGATVITFEEAKDGKPLVH